MGQTQLHSRANDYDSRTSDTKTHKRLNRVRLNRTKQEKMRIFEDVLFFKATHNTSTNKPVTYPLPVGFLQKEGLFVIRTAVMYLGGFG